MSDFDIEKAKKIHDAQMNPPEVEFGMEGNSGYSREDEYGGIADWFKNNKDWKNESAAAGAEVLGVSHNDGSLSPIQPSPTITPSSDFLSGATPTFEGNFQKPEIAQGGATVGIPDQDASARKFEEGLINGFKGFFSFLKEFVSSFKSIDVEFTSKMGNSLKVWGTVLLVVSIILNIISVFTKLDNFIALSGSSLMIIGLGWLLSLRVFVKTYDGVEEEPVSSKLSQEEEEDLSFLESIGKNDSKDDSYIDEYEFNPQPTPSYVMPSLSSIKDTASRDSIINSIGDLDPSMYTRGYLFEMLSAYLPKSIPEFYKMTNISSSSEKFLRLNQMIVEASQFLGISDENIPVLMTLEENTFILKLTCSRKNKINTDSLVEELANVYKHNDDGSMKSNGIYATFEEYGKSLIINIFKGEKVFISVGDMFLACKDFVLDTNNMLPVVLGVDEYGKPVIKDFKSINSMIIAGEPRSGKSVLMQSIVTQLCMFNSPQEVQFFVLDVKGSMSDFYGVNTNHILKFVSDSEECINTLKYIVREVAPQRAKDLSDKGHINILDYKKEYPLDDMPFIYVIIDEMASLTKNMTKEEKQEFSSLLVTLVSQFPAAGIRLICVPHRVVNDIIPKNVSALVPCRIQVMGTRADIVNTCGDEAKNFKYQLAVVGDTAMRIREYNNNLPFYCHASALTIEEQRNNPLGVGGIFNIINKLWEKVKPSGIVGLEEGVKGQKEVDLF